MEIKLTFNDQPSDMQKRIAYARSMREENGQSTIVLFEIGSTYEAYDESAELIHMNCKTHIVYTETFAFTDFKKDCEDWIFPRMIRKGYKLVIITKQYMNN